MAAGILAATLFGLEAMGGVLVGGAITYFNLLWISALVRKLLEGEGGSTWLAIKFVGKELLLFAVVGALVALKLVAVIPFLIGLSSLVVSVFIAGLSRLKGADPESATDDDPESLSC